MILKKYPARILAPNKNSRACPLPKIFHARSASRKKAFKNKKNRKLSCGHTSREKNPSARNGLKRGLIPNLQLASQMVSNIGDKINQTTVKGFTNKATINNVYLS